MTFLGIRLDTNACTLTIPHEKITACQELLGDWLRKATATKKHVQPLLGTLVLDLTAHS